MKWKKLFLCLLACALLGLTACAKSGPEPVFSDLDAAQITSGEVHNWSIEYGTPLTQEDLARAVELLQPLEGVPLANATVEPLYGGVPTIQFTLTDDSQLTVTLYGRNGIDLIVTTPDGETCYDVEQSKLAPILEIIQSYNPPELPITPE